MIHTFAFNVDWHLLGQRVFNPGHDFVRALWTTIYVSVAAMVLGLVLGLLSALAARSRTAPLRAVAALYTWVMRGTPLVVQVFFIYFGANPLFGFDLFPRTVGLFGLDISGAVAAGIVALALNEGAYMSEIIRAGLNAVDRGQMEAALSVGMRHSMAMRRVILPQAARIIVPPVGNQFNSMMKNTSLLAFIGVYELFEDAQVHYAADFKPVENFTAVALSYLLLTTIWQLIQVQIEHKLSASERDAKVTLRQRLFGVRTELQRTA